MPTVYKVLGQSAPEATTDTNLYTVPASTQAVVSTISIANRSSSVASLFRVAVRPNGATIANQHYIAYDASIGAADAINLTLGVTLATGDIITVRSSTENLSFNVFGSEIS